MSGTEYLKRFLQSLAKLLSDDEKELPKHPFHYEREY
jgi:hypothetical protein